MGNNDFEAPPDFESNPFPDPNQDPFSRQNQVRIKLFTQLGILQALNFNFPT